MYFVIFPLSLVMASNPSKKGMMLNSMLSKVLRDSRLQM